MCLLEPGGFLDECGAVPPLAEAEGGAGAGERQADDRAGVDQVVVHEDVVGRGQDRGEHHDEQDGGRGGRDAHADAQDEGDADAGEGEHEEPVGPGGAGDGVVEALERAGRGELEEAGGRVPAVDPGGLGRRLVAEAEQLVEERPQEDCAEGDAHAGEDVAGGGDAAGGGGALLRAGCGDRSGGLLCDGGHDRVPFPGGGLLSMPSCTVSLARRTAADQGRPYRPGRTKVPQRCTTVDGSPRTREYVVLAGAATGRRPTGAVWRFG